MAIQNKAEWFIIIDWIASLRSQRIRVCENAERSSNYEDAHSHDSGERHRGSLDCHAAAIALLAMTRKKSELCTLNPEHCICTLNTKKGRGRDLFQKRIDLFRYFL